VSHRYRMQGYGFDAILARPSPTCWCPTRPWDRVITGSSWRRPAEGHRCARSMFVDFRATNWRRRARRRRRWLARTTRATSHDNR